MCDPSEEAASQLRAIRALMEKSTIYRAISAPAAGFAGILSLLVCGWLWSRRATAVEPGVFLGIWLGVLVLASLVNFALLYRSARHRGDAFVSAGMKHALQAILPPLFAGFVLSVLTMRGDYGGGDHSHAGMASLWILFYGLALLATGSFSPRSMRALGAAFFVFGLIASVPEMHSLGGSPYEAGVLLMAFSFGLLHLIYAAAVLMQSRRESSAPSRA